jgi:hypothetical protein
VTAAVPLRETEQFKRGRNGELFVADQLRAIAAPKTSAP